MSKAKDIASPFFSGLASTLSPFWAMTNAVARAVLLPRAEKLPVPVISVGNIMAGGTGKTEIAILIAQRLIKEGKRVVIASRGYGSNWQENGAVAHDYATAHSLDFPDEAQVSLKKCPGLMVAVGKDRKKVLRKHWEELNPDVVILDDGFQHFSIARDLDVVVHDFRMRNPLLRDLPSMLCKAGVRVSFSELPELWKKSSTKYPWSQVSYQLTGVFDASGAQSSLPQEAIVFCGLGNPKRFKDALESNGVNVRGFLALSDHHRYDEQSVRKILARAKGLPLLTTLKDYVKLSRFVESQGGLIGFEPRWVGVDIKFQENEKIFWDMIRRAVMTQ